jgi:hypothetical protein
MVGEKHQPRRKNNHKSIMDKNKALFLPHEF